MKRSDYHSQDNWDDDFDRKKLKKTTLKKSDYKRKEKYKNNFFNDEY